MKSADRPIKLIVAAATSSHWFPWGVPQTPKKKAFEAEKLLVAAGFTYKVADTPEKLEQLKQLPQHKLIRYVLSGRTYYLYPEHFSG